MIFYTSYIIIIIYTLLYCEVHLWYFHIIFSDAEGWIDQLYPKNESYCCHCPSLELVCCFELPPVPLHIWWSIPDEDIVNIADDDKVEGHMIDNSTVAAGKSTLKVSNSTFLRANYECIAIYGNGAQNKSEPRPVPPVEG